MRKSKIRYGLTDTLPMNRAPSGLAPMIAVDRDAATPIHRQIYDAYRTAIVEGGLRPGQRIPSSRVLASELGVSRFPVLNAYAQLLAEGYFMSRVGAGTVVSTSLPDQFPSSVSAAVKPAVMRSGPRPVAQRCALLTRHHASPWLLGWGAFGVGQVAIDQFPVNTWADIVARHALSTKIQSFHYSDGMGSPALRETIASYLKISRSLHCDASQIMIVSGSQQALEISARVLIDPGNKVWMEEPSYHLARNVFTLAGSRIVSVPVDDEGLNVAAGIKLCPKARLAYVTPSHQFPLGHTMSASRRLQLLDWAQKTGAWIIEDDYDSEYRYESLPIASVQGLDSNSRVIYVGTFSKVLFPSLRLGYLVIPPDLVDRFLTIRRVIDLSPPGMYQEVLAEFMNEGHFARHIRRMRVLYRERRSVLVDSIGRELGPMVGALGSEAGMHLTVLLPKRSRDLEIAQRAAQQKLWIWPLTDAYFGKTPRPGFILGFGSTSVEEIPRAVRHLRDLIAAKPG
jgi:GntR family transcriptional regulator/MocR family aminotransferase